MSQIAKSAAIRSVAIQGELGSNSHVAALAMFAGVEAASLEIVPCNASADVIQAVISGRVDGAVLPIENSLHGSVAEHYDLLLTHPVRMVRESLLHIRHNVIARPGVALGEIRRVLSHPVALSQCRRWLAAHPGIEVVSFYDTAGSVKHVMADGLTDVAGIAPELAAEYYGGAILVQGIEDHTENFTRFHLLVLEEGWVPDPASNKASIAFTLNHQPGTLVRALAEVAAAGVNLTKIESRPVPGRPWEYVFFVDLRFDSMAAIDAALAGLAPHCKSLDELGRYIAA